MTMPKPSVLLVDDVQASLTGLGDRLRQLFGSDADLVTWRPTPADGPTRKAFEERIDHRTALVITDYDLTKSVNGLFGLSIVAWCQSKFIPVGDFSRANLDELPREPNLFELRVPTDYNQAAHFIDNVLKGFQFIRAWIGQTPDVIKEPKSLAAVLSALLEKPHAEPMFAAYMTKLGTANSALLQAIKGFADPEKSPTDDEKLRILTYVLGHVLVNAVLKYPGPIVSIEALCAYLGTSLDEREALSEIFEEAKYEGPFGHSGNYYWHETIDATLDDMAGEVGDQNFESLAEYNRHIVESRLLRPLAKHECKRCDGVKGGFWCPFTARAVCERGDCSAPSSSWIPSGAFLSRVELDFHDEWAPILGY